MDLQENIYKKVKKTYYVSAGFAGQHVVDFGDLNIDIFLEVQDKKYSQRLYLIDYIAYGFHLWYNINIQGYLLKTNFANILTNKQSV